MSELEQHFRLLLVDNRGIGRSDAPRPPYTTGKMADDLALVLDDAKIARAHVFGISLGGMIAQELALRHPRKVERLVLGCTRAGGRHSRGMSLRTIFRLVGPMRLPVDQAVRATSTIVLSAPFLRAHPEVVDDWVRLARELPPKPRGVIGQLLAGARHDASSRLSRLSAPTLLLTGDADRLIDPENSRLLAKRIPGARLELLGGAGHDFPTEQPVEAARVIRAFLEE